MKEPCPSKFEMELVLKKCVRKKQCESSSEDDDIPHFRLCSAFWMLLQPALLQPCVMSSAITCRHRPFSKVKANGPMLPSVKSLARLRCRKYQQLQLEQGFLWRRRVYNNMRHLCSQDFRILQESSFKKVPSSLNCRSEAYIRQRTTSLKTFACMVSKRPGGSLPSRSRLFFVALYSKDYCLLYSSLHQP